MKLARTVTIALLTIWALAACDVSVNRSIRVADGESVEGDRITVNGRIRIGSGAEVRGDCQTVNGRITVGDDSRVGSLSTVNGRIMLGQNVTVEGDLATVELLLAHEADPNLETEDGATALSLAGEGEHAEVVARLHKAGAGQ